MAEDEDVERCSCCKHDVDDCECECCGECGDCMGPCGPAYKCSLECCDRCRNCCECVKCSKGGECMPHGEDVIECICCYEDDRGPVCTGCCRCYICEECGLCNDPSHEHRQCKRAPEVESAEAEAQADASEPAPEDEPIKVLTLDGRWITEEQAGGGIRIVLRTDEAKEAPEVDCACISRTVHWLCTRPQGHTGDHVAHRLLGSGIWRWQNEDDPMSDGRGPQSVSDTAPVELGSIADIDRMLKELDDL